MTKLEPEREIMKEMRKLREKGENLFFLNLPSFAEFPSHKRDKYFLKQYTPNFIYPQKEVLTILNKISEYWEAKPNFFEECHKKEVEQVLEILEVYKNKFLAIIEKVDKVGGAS